MTMAFVSPAHAAVSPTNDVVWHWYAHCTSAKQIETDIIFHRRKIYSVVFPVCHMSRGAIIPENTQRTLIFEISDRRESLFGERLGEHLEGNIWEAGEDEDAVLLGVSIAGPKRIWCNTIHVLDPGKPSEMFLAKGLLIRTRPRE
jgi:hypothetical protein